MFEGLCKTWTLDWTGLDWTRGGWTSLQARGLDWTGLIHYVNMRIAIAGGPLFSVEIKRECFACTLFPMDIIIISSQELTGNLYKPLILVS